MRHCRSTIELKKHHENLRHGHLFCHNITDRTCLPCWDCSGPHPSWQSDWTCDDMGLRPTYNTKAKSTLRQQMLYLTCDKFKIGGT